MFSNGRNRTVMLAAALALLATAFGFVSSSANAQSSCFGRTPTIIAKPGVVTVGTKGPDVILGTSGNDIIKGRGGRDLICSGAGADSVYGGKGRDYIDLGGGADKATGGSGHDFIAGGNGNDVIRGKRGNDEIRAEGGADRCYGGPGRDFLHSCNDKPATSASASGLSNAEAEMADLVNGLRSRVGARSLRVNLEMSGVARDWSRQLPSGFRHNPAVGSLIPSGWTSWGENIAYNSSVNAAFNALVNSPGHYANMTNSSFSEIGVGVHVDDGWVYVTQVFARY